MRNRLLRLLVRAFCAVAFCLWLGCVPPDPPGGASGTLTLGSNGTDPWYPTTIVDLDLDLATDRTVTRFVGIDAHRTRTGETAFLQYMGGPYPVPVIFGVVVADSQGATGAPLYTSNNYGFTSDRNLSAPRLSPNGRRVAFGIVGEGGSVCLDSNGLYWTSFVVVRDRYTGAEEARFEGYYHPEWLPDGRLLMMGTPCRDAGLWATDASLGNLARADGGKVGTPAALPVVSPADPNLVAFVWNAQLWQITLDAQHTLTALTQFDKSVQAAAWSPDGRMLAVLQWDISMPIQALVTFRPNDQSSVKVRQLDFYPYGPISWN